MPLHLPPRRSLLLIVLFALAVRLLAVAVVGDRELAYEFAVLTQNMLEGRGYSYFGVQADGVVVESTENVVRALPSAYMPPAYPLALGAMTRLVGTGTGGVVGVTVAQAVLGAICCVLMLLLGQAFFDRSTGLLAALGFAVYPVLVYAPSQISAAALYVPLFLLGLWLLARAVRTGRALDVALAGAVFGLNVLARAEFVLLLPLVWGWFFLARTPRSGQSVVLLTLAAAAVLTPWALRNAAEVGVATPMTTSGGRNLWEGYGNQAVGTHSAYAHPPRALSPALDAEIRALVPDAGYERALDAVYRRHALEAIATDPGRALSLWAKKGWLFWGHFGGEDIRYPGASSPAFWGPWLLLLFPFLLGLARSIRVDARRHAFLYAYLVAQTVVVTGFFVLPRYRLAIIPVMLLFAAYGVLGLWEAYPRRLRTHAAAAP